MKTLIVYAHPSGESFNAAILEQVQQVARTSGDCETLDLNDCHFDPVRSIADMPSNGDTDLPEDVKTEQKRIASADHLIFVYPVWWFGHPAILKGWCDRLLTPEFAYRIDRNTGKIEGLLAGKKASVITTSALVQADSPELDWITKPMTQGTLRFCGMADTDALNLLAVPLVDKASRREMLNQVEAFLVQRITPDCTHKSSGMVNA